MEKNADPERQARYDADRRCMNRASTGAVFGSSLLMVILGNPYVMTHLAAFMTGEEEILEFKAFSLTNLKGGATSLLIGAALYLIVVRRVLYRNGSYVNLWPKGLDLEEAVYRPMLTRILPGIFGTAAAVFGENKVLKPLAKTVLFLGKLVGRAMAEGTDSLIALLRYTAFREKAVAGEKEPTADRIHIVREELGAVMEPLRGNFTTAMMMTCIGILLILGTMIVILM